MTHQRFLNNGYEIWSPCYNCKSAVKLTPHPSDWEQNLNSIGAVFTKNSTSLYPQIKKREDFDAKEDIVSCVRCIGETVLNLSNETYRQCVHCGQYFDDSDAEIVDDVGCCFYEGTSLDIHVKSCSEKTRHYSTGYPTPGHFDGNRWGFHRRHPKKKPPKAFLIRKKQL